MCIFRLICEKKNKTESSVCIIGHISHMSLLLAPIMPALKKMSAWNDFPSSRGMINNTVLRRRTNEVSVCFFLRRCGTQEACWLENTLVFEAIRMGNFWRWTWSAALSADGEEGRALGTAGVQWYISNSRRARREVEEGLLESSLAVSASVTLVWKVTSCFSSPPWQESGPSLAGTISPSACLLCGGGPWACEDNSFGVVPLLFYLEE